MKEALDIQVKGIVQGVGFRPFVYRMAKKYLITGWVLNATDGVFIHAEGESKHLDEFVMELSDNAPAAAQVKEIELKEVPLEDFDTFEIRFSDDGAVERTTFVSPDLATCDDCVRELFNLNDRRYRYPFINCTNCGPRFTIIDRLPYDRANTSMEAFPMCETCAREYGDPLDRRFHAQPDACFECGPHITFYLNKKLYDDAADSTGTYPSLSELSVTARRQLPRSFPQEDFLVAHVTRGASELRAPVESSLPDSDKGDTNKHDDSDVVYWGMSRDESDAILAAAVDMLLDGKVLAVKGLGGFHLVCDANNADAVETLRRRKRREGKAFAVMVADVDAARHMCRVSDEEAAVLKSPAAPIVLLRKKRDAAFAPKLADALPELGVMLPYTPLQHLLMHDFAQAALTRLSADAGPWAANPPMLVMTSGNLHDEPIVTDDEEAYVKLAEVADAFIGNDRPIRTRFDDSVVRVIEAGSAGAAIQVIRRARGYAPQPLILPGVPAEHPVIFATGPEQKNTFTLLRGDEAFMSQHIGDMEDAETYDAWLAAKARFEELFHMAPDLVACDLHPEYLTTKWASDLDLPLIKVQHHQAHIVSVMAEHGIADAVCGIAFDGTGYGPDGAIWGGETLLANTADFERFANFVYVPMPGGAACVKHPLRMAYGVLWTYDLLEHPAAQSAIDALGDAAAICEQMIESGLNTPMTSSVGRLFDAASALLGICTEPTYEGEGAILLEAAMDSSGAEDAGAAARELRAQLPEDHGHGIDDADPASHKAREDELLAKERYAVTVVKNTATPESTAQDTSVVLFDAEQTFKALLDDKAAGVPVGEIARRFHDAIVGAVVMAAELVRAMYGISTVALSGGCFMNRYLITHAIRDLEQAGFTVAINRDVPPNDGCISLGQAVVAWSQTQQTPAPEGDGPSGESA